MLTHALRAQRHALKGPADAFIGAAWSDVPAPELVDVTRFCSCCRAGANRRLAKAGALGLLPCHYSQLPSLIRSGHIEAESFCYRSHRPTKMAAAASRWPRNNCRPLSRSWPTCSSGSEAFPKRCLQRWKPGGTWASTRARWAKQRSPSSSRVPTKMRACSAWTWRARLSSTHDARAPCGSAIPRTACRYPRLSRRTLSAVPAGYEPRARRAPGWP